MGEYAPGLVALVVLLAVNGFFVGAEFAVISARRSQIEPRAEAGSTAALVAPVGARPRLGLACERCEERRRAHPGRPGRRVPGRWGLLVRRCPACEPSAARRSLSGSRTNGRRPGLQAHALRLALTPHDADDR